MSSLNCIKEIHSENVLLNSDATPGKLRSCSINNSVLINRSTKLSERRLKKRVVSKDGECNIVQTNVARRRRKYLQDIFTTLVDIRWRFTLMVFALNFILSWLAFAVLWWLVAALHGDLDSNSTHHKCVEGIDSFSSAFFFSVETQQTIGYGSKHPTGECMQAILVLCVQSLASIMIQAFMVGIMFAKLSRPKKRTQTLSFSKQAVICQRDGKMCFLFRVGDMRKSHIVEAHVRAQLIRKKTTVEGEILPFYQYEMKVSGDGGTDRIIFIWPITIVHQITPESPLYQLSAQDLSRDKFEIVVVLEGIIESTGMTTQARSSYLPDEILWGHRFTNIISPRKETGQREVNHSLLDCTYQVDTPVCSAYTLDRMLQARNRNKQKRFKNKESSNSEENGLEDNYYFANYQTGRQRNKKEQPDSVSIAIDVDETFNASHST